ncbi:MAG TPA: FAD:protein FMN transferase [Methylibium sp.]|nr:FAD:protein FMN transferase [Methylibium sp.]
MAEDIGLAFQAMACEAEVRIAGLPEREALALAGRAADEVRRIEARWSRYRADSLVSRINAAAGSGQAVEVDAETAGLIDFAARLHDRSGGRFDLTAGVLRRAWDFRAARRPSDAELEALRPLIGWPKVQWDGRRLLLPRTGMEIDLGGLGKEYAVDRAVTLLQAAGVRHALVNLGGDLRVLGPRADGSPWRIAIRHPREADRPLASVALVDAAVATSGDYERGFVDADGVRCHHLLDARSGRPVGHWQAVSVVAPACMAAGALATLAMLMEDEAPALLADEGVAWLAVDAAGRRQGPGLADAAPLPSSRSQN